MRSDRGYALRCAGIGKRYRIGARRLPYRRLSEEVFGWLRGGRAAVERFWALRDVTFSVEPGEIVGVIGRNGAGKTTLLKILSGVTKPTVGEARVVGRVGSMLEVGTGFHPELTGRENVYLNGAILGMRRSEIASRFDDIVEFAQLERFIDTPVKRYSSGMHLRLGFAVAAHLDTNILLVDEVLAVGDAGFQQRCFERMRSIALSGRTILFVSHNMPAVMNLCGRAIVLESGRVETIDKTETAIQCYLRRREDLRDRSIARRTDRTGDGRVKFDSIAFEWPDGGEVASASTGQSLIVHVVLRKTVPQRVTDLGVMLQVVSSTGQLVGSLWTEYSRLRFDMVDDVRHLYCTIPKLQLAPGRYLLNVGMSSGNVAADWLEEAAELTVDSADYYGVGLLVRREKQGLVLLDQEWRVG